MSINTLPGHFALDYKQNFFHRIQQFPSLLAAAVTDDSINGEMSRYSQLEQQEMVDLLVRHGVTQTQDAETFIRWMKNKKHAITNLIDEWDDKDLGVQMSPKSKLIENQGFSYNRKKDSTILRAAEGDATTGEDADIIVPLPATQRVGVSFVAPGGTPIDSVFTFAKVVRARRIFRDNNLPLARGQSFAVISPQSEEDLIRDINEARNKDFAAIAPIEDGEMHGKFWMGFNWIVHTDLTEATVTGTGGPVQATQNLFWHKSFVYFGDGEKRSNVDILPQREHAVQCRTRTRMGGMRFEEKGVVVVETLV